MVGIKVLFIDFLKKVNSYLFFSEILNSYLEKLIPTYLLVKSLIPSLKGGGDIGVKSLKFLVMKGIVPYPMGGGGWGVVRKFKSRNAIF